MLMKKALMSMSVEIPISKGCYCQSSLREPELSDGDDAVDGRCVE